MKLLTPLWTALLLLHCIEPKQSQSQTSASKDTDRKSSSAATPSDMEEKIEGMVLSIQDKQSYQMDSEIFLQNYHLWKNHNPKKNAQEFFQFILETYILAYLGDNKGYTEAKEFQTKMDRLRYQIRSYKNSVLYDLYVKDKVSKFEKGIAVSEQELKHEAQKNPIIRASHILIKVDQKDDEKQKQAALQKIQAIHQEVTKAPNRFAEIAKEKSQGPSASRGGDLGFFGEGRMVQEFDQAAFALENAGDISDVVKTQFGYHVIMLTGRKHWKDRKDKLEEVIAARKKQEFIENELTEKAMDKHKVTYHKANSPLLVTIDKNYSVLREDFEKQFAEVQKFQSNVPKKEFQQRFIERIVIGIEANQTPYTDHPRYQRVVEETSQALPVRRAQYLSRLYIKKDIDPKIESWTPTVQQLTKYNDQNPKIQARLIELRH